jgi:predicted NBD/HSP70 family sugar kinase
LVTKAVNELLIEGQISNCGLRASTGGRRATSFNLNIENHGCIITLAIDQYSLTATAFSLDNKQLFPTCTVVTALKENPDVYDKIIQLLSDTITNLSDKRILGIGITVPGFVDSTHGINTSFPAQSPMYALQNNVQEHFGIQTFIENDSSAIAIAEKNFGLAQDVADSLVINLNWGVGLGIIVQHQLFKGYSGFAGEFSHIPLANENKLCSCGKKGCLEVEASLLSAMGYITQALDDGQPSSLENVYHKQGKLTFENIYDAYQRGDQVTIVALKRIAHMLGKGIATLIHILNPQTIIISGKGAEFGDIILPQIQSSVQEYCIPRLSKGTNIEISEIKNIQLLASVCIAVQQMKWDYHEQKLT